MMWSEKTPRQTERDAHQSMFVVAFMALFVALATLYGVVAGTGMGLLSLGLGSVFLGLLCLLTLMSYRSYLAARKWRLDIELAESRHRTSTVKQESTRL